MMQCSTWMTLQTWFIHWLENRNLWQYHGKMATIYYIPWWNLTLFWHPILSQMYHFYSVFHKHYCFRDHIVSFYVLTLMEYHWRDLFWLKMEQISIYTPLYMAEWLLTHYWMERKGCKKLTAKPSIWHILWTVKPFKHYTYMSWEDKCML